MFTVAAVTGVRAKPIFDFPDVIHRAEIPAGITVHEFNATAAALGAATAPELESRKLLKERSDCHGSFMCKLFVDGRNCRLASDVRDGKETHTQTYLPRGNSFSQLRGLLCGLADTSMRRIEIS